MAFCREIAFMCVARLAKVDVAVYDARKQPEPFGIDHAVDGSAASGVMAVGDFSYLLSAYDDGAYKRNAISSNDGIFYLSG
jgi:hypothetical protein